MARPLDPQTGTGPLNPASSNTPLCVTQEENTGRKRKRMMEQDKEESRGEEKKKKRGINEM